MHAACRAAKEVARPHRPACRALPVALEIAALSRECPGTRTKAVASTMAGQRHARRVYVLRGWRRRRRRPLPGWQAARPPHNPSPASGRSIALYKRVRRCAGGFCGAAQAIPQTTAPSNQRPPDCQQHLHGSTKLITVFLRRASAQAPSSRQPWKLAAAASPTSRAAHRRRSAPRRCISANRSNAHNSGRRKSLMHGRRQGLRQQQEPVSRDAHTGHGCRRPGLNKQFCFHRPLKRQATSFCACHQGLLRTVLATAP